MITAILEELNKENGSNYKLEVLRKHKENDLLKKVLSHTYDNVKYTYGITMKNIPNYTCTSKKTLDEGLKSLVNLYNRIHTGNNAIEFLTGVLSELNPSDALILEKVINRDLRINLGRTQINKIFPNLITKQTYMRCDVFSLDKIIDGKKKKGTASNISFKNGAFIQKKADGTFREFTVDSGMVTSTSRSGENYEYPVIFKEMKNYPNGVYTGELTVKGINNRAESNGLINSLTPPHDDILLELWDYIETKEYNYAANKLKTNKVYKERFETLNKIVRNSKNVFVIESYIVNSIEEASNETTKWMNNGFEGAVLKDFNGLYKDGTSKHQLKMKVSFSLDLRITGFTEGTKGTKREQTFGAIMFESDDGLIKGQTSGFTDAQLSDFNSKRNELIGTIIEVEANDLVQGKNNDYYALSHPRFIELRGDKDTTDDIQRALDSLEMAKQFRGKII